MISKLWMTLTYAGALTVASGLSPVSALYAQQTAAGQPLAKDAVLSSLTSKLDTKKSKVGDPVSAKTIIPLTFNDGSVLPAGSKLTGKVTQVQSKSSGIATLGIVFDQLEKKGSAPIPIHGQLIALAAAPNLSDSGAATGDLPMGSGGNKAQTTALTGSNISGEPGAPPPLAAGSSIKGITLDPSPGKDSSGVLESKDKDFKLDNGTRLEIGLTGAQ
jgi:hypothetical protein